MEEKKKISISLTTLVFIIIIVALLCVALTYLLVSGKLSKIPSKEQQDTQQVAQTKIIKVNNDTITENPIKSGCVSNFDLSFLKMENKNENVIYSPLSIKYALKMLEEGSNGETKSQISSLIGKYNLTTYTSNANMALANSLFVRDTYRSNIKDSYINTLKTKYNAEVKYDSFKSVDNINSWINNNTLGLIDNMLDDIDEDQTFYLINALGIDMDWNEVFLVKDGHFKSWNYPHEKYEDVTGPMNVSSRVFNNSKTVSGMSFKADVNNYDIINELGEDNIRKIVGDEYRKWAKSLAPERWPYEDDLSDENIEKHLKIFLDGGQNEYGYIEEGYIAELSKNYGQVNSTTDFSAYVDNNVKVFAKDLKKYNGTTLQYIGIMPIDEDLSTFVKNIDETKINQIINSLKELKSENYKEGVITRFVGYVPKFNFEYDLDLKNSLKALGIKDVFDSSKADLSNITDIKGTYIDSALHKANIEFTQDGIKASAATIIGGLGAGGDYFDYIFDVPIEEIDLTFDKPYMFIIRDKKTGETWFTGTVYNPLDWNEEPDRLKGENGKA